MQERLSLLDKRVELEVMKSYLAADNKRIDDETDPRKLQTEFDVKIHDLELWTQINGGVEKKLWEQAEQLHLEKLEKYRF